MLQTSVDSYHAIYETVQAGRNLRSDPSCRQTERYVFILRTDDKPISEQTPILARLLNAEEVTSIAKYMATGWHASRSHSARRTFSRYRSACGPSRASANGWIRKLRRIDEEARTVEAKLQNNSFVDRAPAAVVEEHRRRLNRLNAQLAKLKQAREGLS